MPILRGFAPKESRSNFVQAAPRVLITGSTGFVGRYLVPALASALPANAEIIAASHRGDNAVGDPKVRVITLDVTSPEQVCAALADNAPSHLFHLAAVSAIPAAQQDIRHTWDINFGGTLNVALGILKHAPECRLIYCSSAQVYGSSNPSKAPIDEDAPLDPENVYAASKAAADVMIGQLTRQQLRAVRMRPFNHSGPGQNENFVVPAFAAQIARIERGEQEPIIRVGDLDSSRDFLDVRDVVDAYVRAVLRFDDLPARCVINIASGRAWSIRTILDILLGLSKKPIQVVQDEKRMRAAETSVLTGSRDAAHRLLGWTPQTDFSMTLSAVLDHYRRL